MNADNQYAIVFNEKQKPIASICTRYLGKEQPPLAFEDMPNAYVVVFVTVYLHECKARAEKILHDESNNLSQEDIDRFGNRAIDAFLDMASKIGTALLQTEVAHA